MFTSLWGDDYGSSLMHALWSASARREARRKERLAAMTIEEAEEHWVQYKVLKQRERVADILTDFAKLTGPWRHIHGYKKRKLNSQSDSLKRLLKKGKSHVRC